MCVSVSEALLVVIGDIPARLTDKTVLNCRSPMLLRHLPPMPSSKHQGHEQSIISLWRIQLSCAKSKTMVAGENNEWALQQ